MVLVNRSAKTVPKETFLEFILIILLFKKSLKILLGLSVPSSVSRSFVLRLDDLTIRENASVSVVFVHQGDCSTDYSKVINYY